MHNNWYVYKHIRLDTGAVFYIGIGNKSNYARAYETHPSKRNNIWSNIFNKTSIRVEIVECGLSRIQAAKKEQQFIRELGRIDLGTGLLCNLTDGGDGIWNCIRGESTRKKLSDGKVGQKNPQYGKKQSEYTVNKRRESLLGKKRTEDTKRKQSMSSIESGQAKRTRVYKGLELLGEFHSISEACRFVGLNPKEYSGKASLVARGIRSHVMGYSFSYI